MSKVAYVAVLCLASISASPAATAKQEETPQSLSAVGVAVTKTRENEPADLNALDKMPPAQVITEASIVLNAFCATRGQFRERV